MALVIIFEAVPPTTIILAPGGDRIEVINRLANQTLILRLFDLTPMNILVTGAAGQLGSYLAQHLSGTHEVVGLDVRKGDNDLGKAEFVMGDIGDYRLALGLCREKDAVIHAAAQVSVDRSVSDPVFDARENIMGTINMLETATKAMAGQFIYISSAAIFGNPEQVPIGEDHPRSPLSPYGVSKLAGENYALAFRETYGLNVCSIRPFNIYSPRQDPDSPYSGVITRFVDRAREEKPLTVHGDGEQTRDFVSARDVVQMVERCLDNPKASGQCFNCGTGVPTTINELAGHIIELSGKTLRIEHVGSRKGDIRHSCADISKASTLLGYAPTIDLKNGLPELMQGL